MAPRSLNPSSQSSDSATTPIFTGKFRLGVVLWIYVSIALIGGLQEASNHPELFESNIETNQNR